MRSLAIITTHPIQYNAPWFKLLNERGNIRVKVFYTWGESVLRNKFDPGFEKNIEWDIPLLEGYDYTFVQNTAQNPGSHHYNGIKNPTLIAEIETWNPDAILIFGWSFVSHLKVLRHFKGKTKLLFRGDSNMLDEKPGFGFKKFARRLFLRWIYWHVDVAMFVGNANKQYYQRHGVRDYKLVFAPHAIDNNRFMNPDAHMQKTDLNIPSNAFVFLYTGKFETKKNPELLLQTFIQLSNDETHLLLVGSGRLESMLKNKVLQQPTAVIQRIHFLPFQNQLAMPAVYRVGDVLVLPSQGPGETWGLAVNEAMACSRAVLVSDKCGCAMDLVKEEVNGFVFKSGDNKDLLQKMALLAADAATSKKMGRESLQIIQPWRFENICEAVERSVA